VIAGQSSYTASITCCLSRHSPGEECEGEVRPITSGSSATPGPAEPLQDPPASTPDIGLRSGGPGDPRTPARSAAGKGRQRYGAGRRQGAQDVGPDQTRCEQRVAAVRAYRRSGVRVRERRAPTLPGSSAERSAVQRGQAHVVTWPAERSTRSISVSRPLLATSSGRVAATTSRGGNSRTGCSSAAEGQRVLVENWRSSRTRRTGLQLGQHGAGPGLEERCRLPAWPSGPDAGDAGPASGGGTSGRTKGPDRLENGARRSIAGMRSHPDTGARAAVPGAERNGPAGLESRPAGPRRTARSGACLAEAPSPASPRNPPYRPPLLPAPVQERSSVRGPPAPPAPAPVLRCRGRVSERAWPAWPAGRTGWAGSVPYAAVVAL